MIKSTNTCDNISPILRLVVKELNLCIADMNYDFNFQQQRIMKEERKLLPGDYLRTTCISDTRERNTTTFVSFYYPAG